MGAGQSFLGWSKKTAIERAVPELGLVGFQQGKREGEASRQKGLTEKKKGIKGRKATDV